MLKSKNNLLWMGDIQFWMSEKYLFDSFIAFGFKPETIKIIGYKREEKLRYFGLVKLKTFLEANKAMFYLNRKKIPNSESYFKLNLSKYNFDNDKIVYVSNLSKKVADNDLYYFFKSRYPSVYYASIMTDNGNSKGYGFVHFSSKEEYNKCLKEMNGEIFYNKQIKVKIKTVKKFGNNEDSLLPNESDNYMIPLYQSLQKHSVDNDKRMVPSDSFSQNYSSSPSLSKEEQKEIFRNNIKLLENSNDTLIKIIQESLNNLHGYYKNRLRDAEIPNILKYYTSNSEH